MHASNPSLTQFVCHVRAVHYLPERCTCSSCQLPAERVGEAERTAIDIDLEDPVLLQVKVSVHYCSVCHQFFRAQPPFLRPNATYTNRVVTKAVESVIEDGMAMRRVSARLARDFKVRPSEGSIRRWRREYEAGLDFAADYQPWVVETFSGILCVDEVYQDRFALLLAVDPAGPNGDRLVGYQLMTGAVTAAEVDTFLNQLKAAGVEPDEVITDGSSLYPAILSKVWPTAAHQLCLFHETRHVTKAVAQLIAALRKNLPAAPPTAHTEMRGRPRNPSPPDNPHDPATQRWHMRQGERHHLMTQVHRLEQEGLSQRAIARQTGLSRNTVKKWLRQEASPLPENLPQALLALDLADIHCSQPHLGEKPTHHPADPVETDPPSPWASWDEVRQTQEALYEQRFLFLHRPEHLSSDEEAQLAALLEGPLGPQLQIARQFLVDWYALWLDEEGQRRSPEEAHVRYGCWCDNPAYQAIPQLHRAQSRIPSQRFEKLSHFLKDPAWEATNNGAERMGRAFRHRQAPHFNLRSKESIAGAIEAAAFQQKKAELNPLSLFNASTRGRKPKHAA